ncbi:MAG TPA: ArsC family reductase [Vicinamibacterales bacterium]|nr:ArsC family reductase [Vicinamibacterales bacterium]
MLTMFGIKNCDTIKKARAWLDAHGVAYRFHDYKIGGIDRESLETWCRAAGWEKVCNRAGTTFKKLPESQREGLTAIKAIALMVEHPSMIKRPVLDIDGTIVVGFSPDDYQRLFRGRR